MQLTPLSTEAGVQGTRINPRARTHRVYTRTLAPWTQNVRNDAHTCVGHSDRVCLTLT